jgi:hypothetical protein
MRSGDRILSEQCLNQRAFRQRAVSALSNDVLEHVLHTPQIGNLRPHVVEVSGGHIARLGAGLVALVDETQQFSDFIKGEAKLPRPQNEAEAPFVCRVVTPITAGRARRFGQQADLFVIAHRLQIAARPPGELGPLQALHQA